MRTHNKIPTQFHIQHHKLMASIGEVSMNCGEKNHFARTRWVMFTEKKMPQNKRVAGYNYFKNGE